MMPLDGAVEQRAHNDHQDDRSSPVEDENDDDVVLKFAKEEDIKIEREQVEERKKAAQDEREVDEYMNEAPLAATTHSPVPESTSNVAKPSPFAPIDRTLYNLTRT